MQPEWSGPMSSMKRYSLSWGVKELNRIKICNRVDSIHACVAIFWKGITGAWNVSLSVIKAIKWGYVTWSVMFILQASRNQTWVNFDGQWVYPCMSRNSSFLHYSPGLHLHVCIPCIITTKFQTLWRILALNWMYQLNVSSCVKSCWPVMGR